MADNMDVLLDNDLLEDPNIDSNKKELHKILPEKLRCLLGVKQFPMRVKCATLAWHTFQAALKKQHRSVSTECLDEIS